MKQYALLPKAEPFLLSSEEDDSNGDEASISEQQTAVGHKLLTLFESYAEAFPNPALQEENQERDRLLRALSAANHAVQINPSKERKSLWSSLFGRSNKKEKAVDLGDVDDDDRLVFTNVLNEDEQSRDFLLGTSCSLDLTCIPEEAHSVARLSLVRTLRSSRRHSPSAPNVARTSWETAGSSCIIVQGLGCVVEFQKESPANQDATPTVDCKGQLQYTSDHVQLLDYVNAKEHRGLSQRNDWEPADAVAVTVGPNLLVVSWGLDLPVVFYRRVAATSDTATAVDENHYVVTWEAVAMAGATQFVQENLVDVFSDEGDDTALLCVTDLMPLVVEVPNHGPIVTLAVARLGGFIELVPLPPQMWYGAELPMTKKHIRPVYHFKHRGQKRKLGNRSSSEKYTPGNHVPDLALNPNGGGGIIAMKTTDYHADVLGLAAFRTSVDKPIEWNLDDGPAGPPSAQYVLAAYGTDAGTGQQIISFWSFSAVLAPSAPGGVGFSMHASFTEAIELGKMGPDVSLFANSKIFRHWRRPRRVDLRESQSSAETPSIGVESSTFHVTTLSVSVPIVQICFTVSTWNDINGDHHVTRAAVLDWNGGVTLLDCTLLESAVSHTTAGNLDEGASLVRLVADRRQTMKEFSKSMGKSVPIGISSIQWCQGLSRDANSLCLAALTYNPCKLLILSSHAKSGSDKKALSFNTTVVSCYKKGCGKLTLYRKYKSTICLVIRTSSSICFCAVQELQPGDMVRSLINASKFKEAIETAESLTLSERGSIDSLVETSKKRLWESELDFTSLSSMKDDTYIIHLALNAYSLNEALPIDQDFLKDDVSLYRSICRLALKRLKSSRIANNLEKSKNARVDITTRLLKLGTYELLCNHLTYKPSLRRFFADFLSLPLLKFVGVFAQRGDISPLSIVWFRHQDELYSHRLQVLSDIPLSTDPRLFQHLLPVFNASTLENEEFGCFMSGPHPHQITNGSNIFDYMNERFQVSIGIDAEDEAMILEHWRIFARSQVVKDDDFVKLADWYHRRTLAIRDFVSSFQITWSFARLAIGGLRNAFSASSLSLLPEIESLQQIVNSLELLMNILSDGTIDLARSSLSILESDAWEKIDTFDIVNLTMRCKSGGDDFQDRYNRYLLPLVKVKLSGNHIDGIYSDVDSAIKKFCLGLISECSSSEGDTAHFLDALATCSNIIWSSRTSLCKSLRIIKNREILIQLVLQYAAEVCSKAQTIHLDIQDQQCVVENLWKAYESLPSSSALHDVFNSQAELEGSFKELEVFRQNLVLVDIFVNWPTVNPFSVLHHYISASLDEKDLPGRLSHSFGSGLVTSLCRLFCHQLKRARASDSSPQKTTKLLSSLLCDIQELNQHCFKGSLQLNHLLPKHLLKPFLLRRDAVLLDAFFSLAFADSIDANEIWKEVVCCCSDIDVGASSVLDKGGYRKAFIECMDVLIKWMPHFKEQFLELRRCHESACYIADILFPGKGVELRPEQIQTMDALAVIDFVLERNPKAIVLNCTQWEDPEWAMHSNECIRSILTVVNMLDPPTEHHSLPPLPGHAVFSLAQFLGCNDVSSMILVKSRVVNVGLDAKLFGAAAAVCRSVIADCSVAGLDITPVLNAVSKTVMHRDFDDIQTKRELCLSVMTLPSTCLQPPMIVPFSSILNVLNNLDFHFQLSRCHQDSALVSIAKLYHDALVEGGVSMTELFSTLHCQLCICRVDDSLLAKVAQHATFWCIKQTTQFGLIPLQVYSTRVVIALAASCFLHIHDQRISKDCLQKMIDAVEHEDNTTDFFTSCDTLNGKFPDPSIVKGLIGRGYSENGARRSALAVQNIGFREALQWAVSHSFDPGFDDLMVVLRSNNEKYKDFESALYLKKVLAWIEEVLNALLNEPVHRPPFWSSEIIHSQSKLDGPSLTQNGNTEVDVSRPVNIKNSHGSEGNKVHVASRVDRDATPSSSLTVNVPSAFPVEHVNNRAREILEDTATSQQRGNESSPDRSVLFQLGQEAFQAAQQRRPTSSPSQTERMRLIEEGRRLLQQARSLSTDSDQRRFFTQSASTTPTSSFINDSVSRSIALFDDQRVHEPEGSVVEPSGIIQESSVDVADEWDFDDENFDLEDD